jgi:outer membrane lipoprotein SlyB
VADRSWQRLIGIILLLTVTACAGPQPILRSNKQLHLYGKQMAQQEIESCREQVEQTGLQPGVRQSTNAATGAVLGLTLGGAVGASAGIVGGLPGIAIGAAAGSGLGLIVGLAGGTFKPLEPEPPYADAVTSCLKEKGYDVSGWE